MSEANAAWAARWKEGRTGFHQEEVNANLVEHWEPTVGPRLGRVLVPLCGMSLDLLWLRERGHHVVGFELSALAIDKFFEALNVKPEKTKQGRFTIHRWDRLEIWEGDFFDITADDLPSLDAWYDRAAIVALSPSLRRRYVDTIWRLLSPEALGLTLTFAYPQSEMEGPPFSVGEDDLRQACAGLFEIQLLECVDLTEGNRWSLTQVLKPIFGVRRIHNGV